MPWTSAQHTILLRLAVPPLFMLLPFERFRGIVTSKHVEILIQEVFEKATTQHHFIDMYADLCTLCHEHFAEHPIGDDHPHATPQTMRINRALPPRSLAG